MKTIHSFRYILTAAAFFLLACSRPGSNEEKQITPKVPVTVTHARVGLITNYTQLNAVSMFLNKSIIKSPVNGYIEDISINPGDRVTKDQKIITLQTRESKALAGDTSSPVKFSGLIFIRSVTDGKVISVDHPVGDFVQEGDPIVSTADPRNLVFILEAPFDLNPYIKLNDLVRVLLPDSSKIEGRIRTQLPSMISSSQTQRFVVTPESTQNLPENLIARIRIHKQTIPKAIILPKACVLSDELMHSFWVMKLINDSTAVKVPVMTGLSTEDSVQIIQPEFTVNDQFLSSGNYGVGDTVFVFVNKKLKE